MTTPAAPPSPQKVVWYPNEDVKAVFSEVFRLYDSVLKSKHRRGWLSREESIARHNMLLVAQEILLALNEGGVLASDLLEWMEEKKKESITSRQEVV